MRCCRDFCPNVARDELIGFQAQCDGCEWASVVHLHKKHAAEDAELHERYYHHMGEIVTIKTLEQIRAVG